MGVMVDLDAGTGMGGDAECDELDNIETVIGSDHADTLYGDTGTQTLDGGKGNDLLRGGGGADMLTGGEGTDTVNYYDSGDGVTVDLSISGAQSTTNNGDASGDTITGVENVQGSDEDDKITGNSVAGWCDGRAVERTCSAGWATTSSSAARAPTSCAATWAMTSSTAWVATTGFAAARAPTRSPAAMAPTP